MGTLYRRKVKHCTTCRQRLVRTVDWRGCVAAGHAVVIRERPIWWIKYQVEGRPQCVSSYSTKKEDAKRLLQEREGDVVKGVPLLASVGRVTFEEAAADLVNDYHMNGRRSTRTAQLRLRNYLTPYFRQRRLSTITTADVRVFITQRLAAGAASGSVNRDLTLIKRMFTLALQGGKLMTRPYIPILKESNIRRGFFEPEQFRSVKGHLPDHMQPIVEFAYVTGWRTPSEILPLEWRQVDMTAGEVRLDAGTTKNGDGRVFPFTIELRRVLEHQHAVAERLKRKGIITRHVFCFTGGWKIGKAITASGFNKAWRKARTEAGCPGRIPHDFRRTAVRNLVRARVPERVTMQLTGHKTRAVFERYKHCECGRSTRRGAKTRYLRLRCGVFISRKLADPSTIIEPESVRGRAPAGQAQNACDGQKRSPPYRRDSHTQQDQGEPAAARAAGQ